MPVEADVYGIERLKDEPHLTEADVKCLGREVGVVLRITGVHERERCAIRRLDAERRAIVRQEKLAAAIGRHQRLRVLAVLRLRLVRLRQVLARRLQADLARRLRDIVRAVLRHLARFYAEERQLGIRLSGQ